MEFITKTLSSIRYMLIYLNALLLVSGLVLLSVGVSTEKSYYEYNIFLTNDYFTLPAFLIATGAIIFLITIFGAYVAYLESFYFIIVFVVLMAILLIFEISAGIGGYSLRKNSVTNIQNSLLSALPLYGGAGNYETTVLWDDMQREFECCGVVGPSDWLRSAVGDIPISCCSPEYGVLTEFHCNITNAYDSGCANALASWAESGALAIGITGVVMTSIQVFITAAAGWIASQARLDNIEY